MPRYKLRTLLILLAIGPPLLALIGPPIVQWLKQKPLEPPTATPNANSNPYFAAYDTGAVDPVMTENVARKLVARKLVARKLLAGTPQTRIQLDSKTGKLSVWGPASAHIDVQAIIAMMQRDAVKAAALAPSTPMFRFTIRDVLWLTVVVGVLVAWWLDHRRIALAAKGDRDTLTIMRSLGFDVEAIKRLGKKPVPGY